MTALRERITARLLAGERTTSIAACERCDRSTVARVRALPTVRLALEQRRSEVLADAQAVADECVLDAMEYIASVVRGTERGDQTRLTAARDIIARSPLATSQSSDDRAEEALTAAAGGPEKLDALIRRRASDALGATSPLPPAADGEHTPPAARGAA